MPHASLKLIPGADRNRTEALNEAAIWDCNLIRFAPDRQGQGLPQKIGGWGKFLDAKTTNPIRALNVWADNNDIRYLGIGTDGFVNTSKEGEPRVNRSPWYYETNIPVKFTTTIGSSVVTIKDVGVNATSYDSIYIKTPVSVGGVVLSGFYSVSNPASVSDTYSIIASNVIGVPQIASSAVTDGGLVPVFSSTTGTLTIKVTLNNHGYSVGSTFPVMVSTKIGNATLYGNYTVTSLPVIDPTNTFTIAASVDPKSTTSVTMNGGNLEVIYFIGQSVVPGSGYGSSGYGLGGYGVGIVTNAGRTYTGVTLTNTGSDYVATLTADVLIPVGSKLTVGTGSTNYTVTESTQGSSTSTFSFTSSTAPAGGSPYSVTVTQWGFVMPDLNAQDWSLDNWGSYFLANPHGGGIFYWNPDTQVGHTIVVPNSPMVNEGMFVAMPERQIIAYGSTFNTFQDPMLVRWCDIADFTDWYATVVNQAGSFRIPKGSKIIGGMQGPQQGLLWTDIGVWSMQYVNQPLIYSFNEVGSGCGLVGRKAMGSLGGTVYWMSQSQFFSLSGGGVQTLQCPVWDVIFQNIDMEYVENVRCAPNSRFGEISWFYPVVGSNGVPTNYVKYNTLLNQWDFGELTRTAWIDQSSFGPPIAAGGDRYIYQHEVGNSADGSAMDSYFQTGYFAIQDGDLQTFLDQVWPDMKWGYGTSIDATVKITFFVANYPGDTPRSYVFDNVSANTKFLTPRLRGRLVSIKIESSDIDSFWRLGNIRYRFQPDGKF